MKLFFILLLALAGLSWPVSRTKNKPTAEIHSTAPEENKVDEEPARLQSQIGKILLAIESQKFCDRYCFLVDMRIHSGKKRFFVYDLKKDSVLTSGLVTHGSGSVSADGKLIFSNVEGSLATSLGRYKIGNEYQGKFGMAFKLTGLDKTNSNAYARAVVLHSHRLVEAEEIYPQETCLSWGCPTVNPDFLLVLKRYIDDAEKPVMLYIFY